MGDEGFNFSRLFPLWLRENKCNIVVSCYRKNRLFCIGMQGSGHVSTYFATVLRPMGLAYDDTDGTILSSERGNITTFKCKGSETCPQYGYFDKLYLPTHVFLSSDTDIHDLRIGADSKLYYVSARFNSICMPSTENSFDVHWIPPWISTVDGMPPAEDRCHLNGMAIVDGLPRFVTSSCISDYSGAWREHHGEGVVYDILNETIVASGLWAPHSPNWYDGKLWIAEAGTGQFGYVDLVERKFVAKKFLPGFIRGITIYNNFALINTSMDRHDYAFKDLPLGHLVEQSGARVRSGVWIIDMNTFDVRHTFEFIDPTSELYDIIVLPDTDRAKIEAIGNVSHDKFVVGI